MTDTAVGGSAGLETPVREFVRDGLTISTDRKRLNLSLLHDVLTTCPWAKGITAEIIDRSIQNSFCFGVYESSAQVGFARVITDFATFAYICDFFIIESHRGRGLGKWLISAILECPEIASLHRKCIVTGEAHGLYRQLGFMSVQRPDAYLELVNQDAYK